MLTLLSSAASAGNAPGNEIVVSRNEDGVELFSNIAPKPATKVSPGIELAAARELIKQTDEISASPPPEDTDHAHESPNTQAPEDH